MFVLTFISGFLLQLSNKKNNFIFFSFLLIILAVFRYGIGLDYFAYNFLYTQLQNTPYLEYSSGLNPQEIGFRLIGSTFKYFGLSYQIYVAFFAIVSMIFMFKIFKRYSLNPTLSMFIFFSFYYTTWVFSGFRQGTVIAIGLYYLLDCLEKKKFMKLVIVSLLLSTIHTSGLSLILFYLLANYKIKKSKLMILSFISIVISLLPMGRIISSLTFLPFFSRILPYLNSNQSLNFLDFQSIARIIFLIVAFYFYNSYSSKDEISEKIIKLYVICFILYFLLQFSELTAARISIYGKYLDTIIFSNILYILKGKNNKYIYITSLLVLCSFYFNKELNHQVESSVAGDYLLTPYVNVFNEGKYQFDNRFLQIMNKIEF